LIRWAFEGLCVNEFTGLQLQPDALSESPLPVSGELTLQRMGLTHSIAQTLIAQLGITLANYVFTCLALQLQDPRGRNVDLTKKNKQNMKQVSKSSGDKKDPLVIAPMKKL
jgi:hypothetical protein